MTFFEYCANKQKEYLPLKGKFIGINMSVDGNIRLYKGIGGALKVPQDRIFEVEPDLRTFLGKDNKFISVWNRKKARNLKTLLP